MRREKRLLAGIALVFTLIFQLGSVSYAAEKPTGTNKAFTSATLGLSNDGNFSNLVVFVEFQDRKFADREISGKKYSGIAEETPEYLKQFDGKYKDKNSAVQNNYPRSMKDYLMKVSYGTLKINNYFPQYDSSKNAIRPLTLKKNAANYLNNPSGSAVGDGEMIKEIAEYINLHDLCQNMNLDAVGGLKGDGVLDNLTILVAGTTTGHKANYGGTEIKISNKIISNYNVIHEEGVLGYSGSGLIIHEFMHSLGYPDLYKNASHTDGSNPPVARWDIMASQNKYVQYPLAYLRSKVTKWLPELEEINTNRNNITLYSPGTAKNREDRQAVVFKTPYSENEFFVAEFRKLQGGAETSGLSAMDDGKSYDRLGGGYHSGLIVYRVNTDIEGLSNMKGKENAVYVFRPYNRNSTGDKYGNIYDAALTGDSISNNGGHIILNGFGSADHSAKLSDNALTYSNGVNSGIVIKNVSDTKGDTISFDVEFNNKDASQYWHIESSDTSGLSSTIAASCYDGKGNMYYILSDGGSKKLYRYDGSNWTKLADNIPNVNECKLVYFKDKLYMAYTENDINTRGKLAVLRDSDFSTLYTFTNSHINYFDIVSYSGGIYMGATDGETVWVTQYDGTHTSKSEVAKGLKFGAGCGVRLGVDENNVCVTYCDFFNNAEGQPLYIKSKAHSSTEWKEFKKPSFTSKIPSIKVDRGKVYLLSNASSDLGEKTRLYVSDGTSDWKQVGDDIAGNNISESELFLINHVPYVFYSDSRDKSSYVKKLSEGKWDKLGENVVSLNTSALNLYAKGEKLYAAGLAGGKAFIRSYAFNENSESGSIPNIEENKQYSIKYILNGGKESTSNPKAYTYQTDSFTLKSPIRIGYSFVGWYSDSQFKTSKLSSVPKGSIGDKTFYARWKPIQYKISFNGNTANSGKMSSLTASYDKNYTLPTVNYKHKGYIFVGWSASKNGSVKYKNKGSVRNLTSKSGATVTLYARWDKIKYKITYKNMSGAQNSKSNPAYYTVISTKFTIKNPTKKGYSFAGWYSDSKFKKKAVITIIKGSTGNRMLYAKWVKKR